MTTTIATRTAPELPRASSDRRGTPLDPTGRLRTGTGRSATRPTLAMQRRLIAQLVG
jgi:hypothetical protein